ncbi:PaaI family thioesterase [[Pseudopropionibacterium] massiliense]|uniref:PaaI family thioesterase n=1 Tax=[Pseudopropionibacterium] massiliense TaxID=2220000 RepID=UPI0010325173|nr:PaaI family thioesterase [[Pseudopropionibacterium] massiliense]
MIDATAIPHSSLHEKLGIEITSARAVEVVGSMPVAGNTQPAGLLHGGATAALVEGLASLAAWLHAQPERVAVGVDLSVTHLRPVASGRVTGRAVPVHLGNGGAVHTVEVRDDTGRLTALGRLTSRFVTPRG